MKKRLLMMIVFFLIINVNIISAKTLEINLIVQGLNPVQETEIYYGYPVNYTVFTNYSVELYDLRVYDFDGEHGNIINAGFKAEILLSDKEILQEIKFEPSFIILSDPPIETDMTLVSLYFNYSDKAKYLQVYWGEEQVLFEEISELLCNENGKCDGSENYLSCSDCKPYGEDGICQGYSGDSYCDKDCYYDTDCPLPTCSSYGSRMSLDDKNVYCDTDGKLKLQKSDLSSCQNSYECESNLCSGGDCVAVKGIIKETSNLKNLVIKILCKLAEKFSLEESYEQCIDNYLK